MKSKIFAIMLAVMMVVSILPTGVFAADPVAKIGDTEYFDISAAFTNATANCTITLLKDVTVTKDWNCQNEGAKFNVPVTIDGNGNTLKFTGKLTNGNWNNVFRFEKEATVKNLTIDVSEAKNAWRVITARVSFNMDNCVIIGDGNTRYGVIVGEGAGSDIDTVVAN
ncbi:MAG: hypothetical protein IJX14_03990, partial [Clostridia bacterium]|nr:hypothetical protein [Clostridia bacterium]